MFQVHPPHYWFSFLYRQDWLCYNKSNTDLDGLIAILVSLHFLIIQLLFLQSHCLYTRSCFHLSLSSWWRPSGILLVMSCDMFKIFFWDLYKSFLEVCSFQTLEWFLSSTVLQYFFSLVLWWLLGPLFILKQGTCCGICPQTDGMGFPEVVIGSLVNSSDGCFQLAARQGQVAVYLVWLWHMELIFSPTSYSLVLWYSEWCII